jgi:hypothetical protein
VDEPRDIEIALGEEFSDVRQVHADLAAARGVLGIIREHFNRPAVFVKAKVVRGGFVREAHGVVAACNYALVVMGLVVPRAGILWRWSLLASGKGEKYQTQRNTKSASYGAKRQIRATGQHQSLDGARQRMLLLREKHAMWNGLFFHKEHRNARKLKKMRHLQMARHSGTLASK